MNVLVLLALFQVAVLALAGWVLFFLYPQSAYVATREALFDLRAELFDVAREGRISFTDSRYRMQRSLINAMIRYAHDVSVLQLLLSKLLLKESSRAEARSIHAALAAAMNEFEPETRAKIDRIMDRAVFNLGYLAIKRSFVFSSFLKVCVLVTRYTRAAKSVVAGEHKQYAAEREIERVIGPRPVISTRRQIRAESWRYMRHEDAGFASPVAA